MAKKERCIPAARFKATCLTLLDEIAASGRSVIVTKRGRPVVRVVPIDVSAAVLTGSIVFEDEVVGPIGEEWDADG